MIKQVKAATVPHSLTTTQNYDGDDVKRQLIEDQHGKCYLCERILSTDFEIDHLRSKHNFPSLIREWSNLFLSCCYCNGKKSDNYDGIVNPLDAEVEGIVKQEFDFSNKKAVFTVMDTDESTAETVKLLNVIYNGTSRCRKVKEERFIEHMISTVNDFSKLILDYLDDSCAANRQAVADDLSISKESLGFKYWIIKSNPLLEREFEQEISWNKQIKQATGTL